MQEKFETSIRLSPKVLRELSVKSDAQGWGQTLAHLFAVGFCTYALMMTWGSATAIPFFILQGILINCLYAGVHELSHNTVFKSKTLNLVFGRLFTFILLMGRDQDKFEHFQHHRHTQNVDLDAEIVGGTPFTLKTYLLYMSGISYWPSRISEVLRLAAGQTARWPWLSPPQFKKVHKEARLMLLGYFFIAGLSFVFNSAAALLFWLLPMFAMKCVHNLQNTAEHTGMPYKPDILINTRTIRANVLVRRLLWNMPYHTAHHSYPSIPFYQLPKLHAALVDASAQKLPMVSHLGFQFHMIKKLIKEDTSAYTGQDITAY